MNSYAALKALHLACIVLSISGFLVRAWWTLHTPALMQRRAVKVIPHVVDTLLLVSGIALAWQLGAEGVRSWLPAKMVALIVYVMLGTIALRRGRTRAAKTAAALAAVLVFLYMVGVATHKDPDVLAWVSALR